MGAPRELPDNEKSDLFLTPAEIKELTGRSFRRLQIAQLEDMRIPFHVNALGNPVVVRANLTGTGATTKQADKGWKPRVVNG